MIASTALTDDELVGLSASNPGWRVERRAGALVMTPPTGTNTGVRNNKLALALAAFAQAHDLVGGIRAAAFVCRTAMPCRPTMLFFASPTGAHWTQSSVRRSPRLSRSSSSSSSPRPTAWGQPSSGASTGSKHFGVEFSGFPSLLRHHPAQFVRVHDDHVRRAHVDEMLVPEAVEGAVDRLARGADHVCHLLVR